jgi:hypothetical protein
MNNKEYSPELIAELEELFPDYTEAIRLGKTNNPLLKLYIVGSYPPGISTDAVLTAISLEDLQKEARLIKRRQAFEKKFLIEWERIKTAIGKETPPKMRGVSLI